MSAATWSATPHANGMDQPNAGRV